MQQKLYVRIMCKKNQSSWLRQYQCVPMLLGLCCVQWLSGSSCVPAMSGAEVQFSSNASAMQGLDTA